MVPAGFKAEDGGGTHRKAHLFSQHFISNDLRDPVMEKD